jgi:SAM-dependent MidA family methyltransferase
VGAVGRAVRWRDAMARALYGPGGFYSRTDDPGGASGQFRTSARASALLAIAIIDLVLEVDRVLGRPDPLDIVDIGAGDGTLLGELDALAPAPLARRLRLCAIEVAPRPHALATGIGWRRGLPATGTVTGLLVATEWLDNVPIDIAQLDGSGVLRYVLVDPATGAEHPGGRLTADDAAWAQRWWPSPPSGGRIELGGPRDVAWTTAVAGLARGLALTVDYGHIASNRPATGTLAGYRAGRAAAVVPDGSCDLTAHVAIDAVRRSGELTAGRHAVLVTQADALAALGLSGARPPIESAHHDPVGYVQALVRAAEAGELMDRAGLGRHYWLAQPVGAGLGAVCARLLRRGAKPVAA